MVKRWVRDVEPFRMIVWALAAVALYMASRYVGAIACEGAEGRLVACYPDLQVALSKYANVTGASWLAYWLARTLLGRIDLYDNEPQTLARAIFAGCVVIAVCLGL